MVMPSQTTLSPAATPARIVSAPVVPTAELTSFKLSW
jgi:hypothetical protein